MGFEYGRGGFALNPNSTLPASKPAPVPTYPVAGRVLNPTRPGWGGVGIRG